MANTHKPTGHEKIETSNFLMIVLILITIAIGGLVEIVPLLIGVAAFGTREAMATSLGAIVVTALAGVTLYAARGKVDVPYALLVGVRGPDGEVKWVESPEVFA